MDWPYRTDTVSGSMDCYPLTPGRFQDMEEVFGDRGTARRCFCMHWRRPDGGFGDRRDNRDRFADRAGRERSPGVLGYLGDIAVGWVQVGPRAEFPTLERSRVVKPVDDADFWSINCFVVRPGHRRRGVATGLLAAAIVFAVDQGARLLEGYPVDGERASVVDYFTGTLGMFEEQGFSEVVRRKVDRPIVRRLV